MKLNIGGLDRITRIVVGFVLIGLAASNVIGIWGWLGMIPLATGLLRFCPLYSILGINSSGSGSGSGSGCGGGGCSK